MGSSIHSTIPLGTAAVGVATDLAGDVFSDALTSIREFSPLASGNTQTATFGVGGGFGLLIGPDGNLYFADGTATNKIDVYLPSQFHDGTTMPDHTITLLGAVLVYFLAFDRAGNLYATAQLPGGTTYAVYVFAPPYTGAPTVVNLGAMHAFGIAVGP
jgi:hypothetical protein